MAEKQVQALAKLLYLSAAPNNQRDDEKLLQEKCMCVYILQYTDQLIQNKMAIASEKFWEKIHPTLMYKRHSPERNYTHTIHSCSRCGFQYS